MIKSIVTGLFAATMLCGSLAAQPTTPPTGRDPATEAARGYATVPSPAEPAVDAQEKPVTAALNNQSAVSADAQSAMNTADHAAAMSQYDQDREAYMAALVRHDAAIDRRDARYVRQQRAYADAMSVWRIQVAECKKGHRKACDAPTPNPADFY